mgnify:CR=1 FL=1
MPCGFLDGKRVCSSAQNNKGGESITTQGETILFYLVMSWKKGYYNKDLIGRHIMLKSWSKIQNKIRIEEITP